MRPKMHDMIPLPLENVPKIVHETIDKWLALLLFYISFLQPGGSLS